MCLRPRLLSDVRRSVRVVVLAIVRRVNSLDDELRIVSDDCISVSEG